jgi:hypothetical protein
MSELKKSIIKNILGKKFNQANGDFGQLMKDKTYIAIDKFKGAFKYVALDPDKNEPVVTTPEEPKDG